MKNRFSEFEKSSLEDWKNQFLKELKGKEHSLLEFCNEVEEISFKAYYHSSETNNKGEQPGNFPYTRGENKPENGWSIGQIVEINDEATANKSILNLLMMGVDSIHLKTCKSNVDWQIVLSRVEIPYINICFEIDSFEEYTAIQQIGPHIGHRNVSFAYDFFKHQNKEDINEFAKKLKKSQQAVFVINAYGLQQVGGNIAQEIGYSLNAGHEILIKLMENGLTIDEAAACIHFKIGIGSNYFNETAKFRALRKLWAKLINAYSPTHSCSHSLTMTAVTGFINKSLKDPHTNLLRQCTETMIAINAGGQTIITQPYDAFSTCETSELARRMAINISLILKEESYFDKVIDPIGGSYSLEHLTHLFGEKGWAFFQELEKLNGIFNQDCIAYLKEQLVFKRKLRENEFNEGKIPMIGINKYINEKPEANSWKKSDSNSFLSIPFLVYEQLAKITSHETN